MELGPFQKAKGNFNSWRNLPVYVLLLTFLVANLWAILAIIYACPLNTPVQLVSDADSGRIHLIAMIETTIDVMLFGL